jgi:O-antigen/teichoic acid export membrane protein
LSIFNTQVDKIVLSKILGVTEFGVYSISTSVASLLLFLSYPIVNTFYPKFCEIKATSDISSYNTYFHNGSQFVGIIVSSVFSFLFFFNVPILNLWGLENNVIVEVSKILNFLLLGFLLSAFTLVPYQVLIANGHFKFILFLNVLFAVLCPIAYYSTFTYFGLLGFTICFALVNLLYLFFLFFFTSDFVLRNERFLWVKKDFIIVLFTSFSSAFICNYLLNTLGFLSKNYFLIILPIIFLIILLLTALNSVIVRRYIVKFTFKNV